MASYTLSGKGVQIYNNLRAGLSPQAKSLLPVGTVNNIGDVANIFRSYPGILNEFLDALSNKVTETIITSVTFNNPLTRFKRSTSLLGDTIEDIYIGLVEEHVYNPVKAESEVFKREIPDVQATYNVRNRESMYKVTVQADQMQAAFQSWSSFEGVVGRIVNTLVTSNERDEYQYIKALPTTAYKNNHTDLVQIGELDSEEALKKFVVELRAKSTELEYINTSTPIGVENATPRDRQVLIISARVDAMTDVNVLASAFNMGKAEFLAKRIVIDHFDDDNILAVLADERFFIVRESLRQSGVIHNPQGLYDNHFLHVWQTLSYSLFNNVVTFVKQIPKDLTYKLIIDDPVQVVGGYGVMESKTGVSVRQYVPLEEGQTWEIKVKSDYNKVTPTVEGDEIKVTVAPDAAPGTNATVTVTATLKKDGTAVSPDVSVTKDMTVQVSRYIGVK